MAKIKRKDRTNAKQQYYRSLAVVLALVLMVGGVVGNTFAWLTAETGKVENTFTYGDIDLKLDEAILDKDGNTVDENGDTLPDRAEKGNDYKMIPGEEYLKDPIVTVEAGNEACWVFVKLVEEGGAKVIKGDGSTVEYDFDTYLEYTVNDELWTQLMDAEGNAVEGVYFLYMGEDTDGIEAPCPVLKDDKIKVKEDVTKEMLNALDDNGENTEQATYPKLSITAYAVQYSGFEAEITEGAEGPTAEQMNAAALSAWAVVEAEQEADNETP